MSYTNETTHYSIPLPLGSDLTTPMDYNTAMQAVDTDLYDAKTTSASASNVANVAKDAVDNITNNVIGGQNGIDARLTTVEGTVSTQGTAITNLGLRVDDVKADAMDMICAKDEGTAQVASVAVDKDEYFRYNDVLYIATADIHIGDTIVPNTNCKATNVATVLEEISTGGNVTASDVTYDNTSSGLSATNVQSAINEINGKITTNNIIGTVESVTFNSNGEANVQLPGIKTTSAVVITNIHPNNDLDAYFWCCNCAVDGTLTIYNKSSSGQHGSITTSFSIIYTV